MRIGLVIALGFLLTEPLLAQTAPEVATKRHGIELRLKKYPQGTAKEALASVLAAIEEGEITYLLAHLADPEFVDKRVKEVHAGVFDELVKESATKLADNPAGVKELAQFLKEGEWEESGNAASVKLKDVKDRQVFLRKIGNRWFLENRKKADESK